VTDREGIGSRVYSPSPRLAKRIANILTLSGKCGSSESGDYRLQAQRPGRKNCRTEGTEDKEVERLSKGQSEAQGFNP
jgi:hypothetical protein